MRWTAQQIQPDSADALASWPKAIRPSDACQLPTSNLHLPKLISDWSVNGSLPLALVRTLQDVYERSMARTTFALVMLVIAGGMALLASRSGSLWPRASPG